MHDAKEQVRQAIDIADLVGEYVQLRRQGSGYVALCPWHADSRPSLQVNPQRQSWKCWVCDIGGDIFSWTMKQEGVEFPEALRMLADRAGIPLARSSGPTTAASEAVEDERRALFQTMVWAEEQYHDFLVRADEAEVARRYLRERGITDDSVHRFHLGFAPDRRDWLTARAREANIPPERLEKVGLVGRSQERGDRFERFRGRVLFSIRDAQGRPVGMGGRLLPELGLSSPAKYVNSPESPLFEKHKLLYGLDVARNGIQRNNRTVLVTEGYTDCIAAHQAGFDNTVAVLGTALGERHTRILGRVADRVVLVLDGDTAGQKRSSEVLELFLAAQLDLRIATLPEGLDPSDFLQQRGADAFRELTENAPDALDFKFQTAFAKVGAGGGVHQTTAAVEEILQSLAGAGVNGPGGTTAVAIKEDQILYRLGRRAGVSEESLRARLSALRKRPQRFQPEAAEPTVHDERQTLDLWERELFEVLLLQPAALAELREVVSDELLNSHAAKLLFALACRLTDEGQAPDFNRLMLELDSPALKSLLVDLDDRGRAKDAQTLDDRVRDVLAGFRQRTAQSKNRAQTVALGEHHVAEDEELRILQEIFEQERKRHGISVPTDG